MRLIPQAFWSRVVSVASLFMLLIVPRASADITLTLDSVTLSNSLGNLGFPYYGWNYTVSVGSGDGLAEIDSGFIIFDFGPIVTISAGGAFQAGSFGTPVGSLPPDDPAILNRSLKADGSRPGPVSLTFTIYSELGSVIEGWYYWQDRTSYPGSSTSLQSGVGRVGVPNFSAASIPEPSSLGLLVAGLAAVAGAIKKKLHR